MSSDKTKVKRSACDYTFQELILSWAQHRAFFGPHHAAARKQRKSVASDYPAQGHKTKNSLELYVKGTKLKKHRFFLTCLSHVPGHEWHPVNYKQCQCESLDTLTLDRKSSKNVLVASCHKLNWWRIKEWIQNYDRLLAGDISIHFLAFASECILECWQNLRKTTKK